MSDDGSLATCVLEKRVPLTQQIAPEGQIEVRVAMQSFVRPVGLKRKACKRGLTLQEEEAGEVYPGRTGQSAACLLSHRQPWKLSGTVARDDGHSRPLETHPGGRNAWLGLPDATPRKAKSWAGVDQRRAWAGWPRRNGAV